MTNQTALQDAITLTRAATYANYMFFIWSGGELTVKSIILDGNKASVTNTGSIIVNNGTLILQIGAVVQNNQAANSGDGVHNGDMSIFNMTGETVSCSNTATNDGSGIYNRSNGFNPKMNHHCYHYALYLFILQQVFQTK